MSLRLLLDENAESAPLIGLLRQRGHDVVGVRELGCKAASDMAVLDLAIREGRTLYTRDRGFYLWSSGRSEHARIIVEHKSSGGQRNMSYHEIADALEDLQKMVADVRNLTLTINSFRRL